MLLPLWHVYNEVPPLTHLCEHLPSAHTDDLEEELYLETGCSDSFSVAKSQNIPVLDKARYSPFNNFRNERRRNHQWEQQAELKRHLRPCRQLWNSKSETNGQYWLLSRPQKKQARSRRFMPYALFSQEMDTLKAWTSFWELLPFQLVAENLRSTWFSTLYGEMSQSMQFVNWLTSCYSSAKSGIYQYETEKSPWNSTLLDGKLYWK